MRVTPAVMIALAVSVPSVAQDGIPPNLRVPGSYPLTFEDDFTTQFSNPDGSQMDPTKWFAPTRTPTNGPVQLPRNALIDTVADGGIGLFRNTVSARLGGEGDGSQVYATTRIDTLRQFGPGSFIVMRSRPLPSPGVQLSGFGFGDLGAGLARQRHPNPPTSLTPLALNDWEVEFETPSPPNNPSTLTFDSSTLFPFPAGPASFPFPGTNDLSTQFTTYGLHWTTTGDLIAYIDFNDNGEFGVNEVVGRDELGEGIAAVGPFIIGMSVNEGFSGPPALAGNLDPSINIFGQSGDIDWVRIYEKADITIAGESFDFSGTADGQNGGSGWNGPWAIRSGAASTSGDGMSLSVPGCDIFEPSGGAVELAAGEMISRELDGFFSINNVDGQQWAAILARRTPGAGVSVGFRLAAFDNRIYRWGFGVNPDGSPFAEVAGPTAGAPTVPADETLLIISKIDKFADVMTPDVASVVVFANGDRLPLSESGLVFDAVDANGANAALKFMDISATGTGSVIVDEFRFAPTYESLLQAISPEISDSFDYPLGGGPLGTGPGDGWEAGWFEDLDGTAGTAVGPALGTIVSGLRFEGSNTEPLGGFGDRLVTESLDMSRLLADPYEMSRENEAIYMAALVKQDVGSRLVLGFDRAAEDFVGGRIAFENGTLVGARIASGAPDLTDLAAQGLPVPIQVNSNRLARSDRAVFERNLGNPGAVNWNATGDKHFAFLLHREQNGGFAMRFSNVNSGTERFFLKAAHNSTDLQFGFVEENANNQTVLPGALPFGETRMVVFHIFPNTDAANTGSDKIRVSVYEPGEIVSGGDQADSWDIEWESTSTSDIAGFFSVVELSFNEQLDEGAMVSGEVSFDEFRAAQRFDAAVSLDGGLAGIESFIYPVGNSIVGQGGSIGFPNTWARTVGSGPDIAANTLEYPARGEFIPGEPVLILTRILSRQGLDNEEIAVKVFAKNDIPLDSNTINWDAEATMTHYAGTNDRVRVFVFQNQLGATTEIDELHIATTLRQAISPLLCSEADLDRDGALTPFDILEFNMNPFDFDENGTTDIFDLLDLLTVYDQGGC